MNTTNIRYKRVTYIGNKVYICQLKGIQIMNFDAWGWFIHLVIFHQTLMYQTPLDAVRTIHIAVLQTQSLVADLMIMNIKVSSVEFVQTYNFHGRTQSHLIIIYIT